jgi:hypothetical protein
MPNLPVSRCALAIVFAIWTAGCCKNNPAAPSAGAAASEGKALQATADPAAAGSSPTRPTTKEACDACQGKWSKHGLAEVDSCICKTKDAGKVCRDGKDCQGDCIADDDGFEVVEAGPPAKGYWKGKCAEYDTTFGCHRTIATGTRAKPPQTAEDAAGTICVD